MASTQVRAQINGTWYTLALDSATGKYFVDLTLTNIGTFPATAEATHEGWQSASLSGADYPGLRLVVQDTVAPTLNVTAPANGFVTAAASVTVTGTAFDTSGLSSVTVNGTAVTVAANGSFSKAVSLSGGSNTITIKATDTAGNVATVTRTVIRATSGPSLTITSPAAGALIQAASVAVSGTVSDSVSPVAAVKVNGVAATISGNTWTANVPLSEGANTLTAVAANQVGLTTTVTRSVTRDSTAPVLNITAPADNLVTAAQSVTVSGTVSDAGTVTVTVNGNAVTLSGGAFSTSVPLSGGSNTIIIKATDNAGNATTATRTVVRATQGPSVTIVSPVSGFITNESSVLVTGTVSDSVALVSGVTVNGAAAAVSSGTFSATVSLTEGANTITVVGTNSVGLTTTKTVSGTLDTVPPEIILTAPTAEQMVGTATFTVTGTVSDAHLFGVTVNGTAATVTDGAFSLEITLTEGANAITATASDAAGNTATATGSVLLDTISPTLTVIAPAGNIITNQPTITVSGTASDSGSGVESVTVDGEQAAEGGGPYSKTLILTEGTNTITVTATDKVGHTTTITRSILLDTAPPVLTLVSPPAGFLNNSTPTVIFSVVDEPGGSGVDLNTVAVLVDGSTYAATVSDGTITITPTLADGPHVITVTVEDVAGNMRGLSASYTVDTVPPELYIRAPYMRHITDEETVTIIAEALDGGSGIASVTIGGVPVGGGLRAAPSSAGGTGIIERGGTEAAPYTATVPLAVGENTITVTATDAAGNQTTAQVYMIRLITDRTREDVAVLEALYDKLQKGTLWTEAETEWFNTALAKGAYNFEDLNRVGIAVRWLAGELQRRGYIADVQTKTDWTKTDAPTIPQMDTYLQNVETVKSAQGLYVPDIPFTMRKSTVEDWNSIEKALVETDKYFPNYFAWSSGEISCGEG